MSYNGYKNFQTWLFMLYFEHDIYQLLKERQDENEKITFETVYETVESIIDELDESIDRIEYGYAFVKDILNASLEEIDIHEVAEHLEHALKEED